MTDQRLHLAVSFGRSTSVNFKRAVEEAATFDSYRCQGEGRDQRHSIECEALLADSGTWERLFSLLHKVGGWVSTSVTLNGDELEGGVWALSQRVEEVSSCFHGRPADGAAEQHCLTHDLGGLEVPTFGCRFLEGVKTDDEYGMHSYTRADEPSWFQVGEFNADRSAFLTDKNRILDELRAGSDGAICTFCPAFDWARIDTQIQALPNEIALDDESDYEVQFSNLDPNKAVGIQKKGRRGYGSSLTISLGDILGERSDREEALERRVPDVRYSDIGGQAAAIERVRDIIELPLTHPEYFEQVGVTPQAGVILYGPPGNGKTLIAKAAATESNAHLELINGPEVLSKWVGQSEANLRAVFDRAYKLQPSLVLLDELDALAGSRDAAAQEHSVRLISQLLVLLDGLRDRGQVIVVGTTNRLEAIDPAILRPGRFDYHVPVPEPDAKGKLEILAIHLSMMKLEESFNPREALDGIATLSGAELAEVCREAGLISIKRGIRSGLEPSQVSVSRADFEAAITTIHQRRGRSPAAGTP